MKATAILMFVHILGGGDRPDVVLVPKEVMDDVSCATYAREHDANTERVSDVFATRPIISSNYSCAFIDKSIAEALKP